MKMDIRELVPIVFVLLCLSLALNAEEKKDSSYQFTPVREIPHTSVKDQFRTELAGHLPVPPSLNRSC